MQVALHVRRGSSHRQSEAWLLPGHDPAALLDGLAALGIEPLPRVYRLACGFFVRPDVACATGLPGALRLA